MARHTMSTQNLTVGSILCHAGRYHGDTEIVSVETHGGIARSNWFGVERNARRLASALERRGLRLGESCATMAWANLHHLEIYFGTACNGQIFHALNPRFNVEQLACDLNQARDRVLFFDEDFLSLVNSLRPKLETVELFVLMGRRNHDLARQMPGLVFYDDLIAGGDPEHEFPDIDEHQPASLCHTSGTTGRAKGVLYTHRSTVLHGLGANGPDGVNISSRDSVMPLVSLYHALSWGTPYVAAAAGARMVLPGSGLDGASLADLIEAEKVTVGLGVPSLWLGLYAELEARGANSCHMVRAIIAGAAMPPALFCGYRDRFGVELVHAWGMTELSPLGSLNQLKAKHLLLSEDAQAGMRMGQGRPPYGVEVRLVDDDGDELPHDGRSKGALQVRGLWVVDTYHGQETPVANAEGWVDTGDVATVDIDGYVCIFDRGKDIIHSAGEWISSVELENLAIAHPAIANAATIAARDPLMDERPVVVAIKAHDVTESELIAYFCEHLPAWQVPDRVIFVEELPLGATGKVQKNKLRDLYGDCLLAEVS